MVTATVYAEHGILFVMDPTNRHVVIPEYVETSLVAATDSCLSVAGQAPCDDDGNTEVTLTFHEVPPPDLFRVAVENIAVPGGRLAISATSPESGIDVAVLPGRISLSVWVDDLKFPTRVLVNVEANLRP